MSSELVLQLLWNGLVNGSLIALIALGLTLVYGVGGFIQFAHGELVASGAYTFLVLHKFLHWPIIPATLGTLIFLLAFSIALEKIFFRPLRSKDPMIPLVSSIGLSIGIQSVLLLLFGPNVQTISDKMYKSLSFFEGKILATPNQIIAVIVSFILMVALILFLRFTRRGKSIRALSCHPELGRSFGIKIDQTMSWIFGIGGVLAGLSGIFLGFEQNLEPLMGVMIGVKAFSALILGGVGSVRGSIVGAYIIGLSESLLVGLGFIPSGFTAAIPFIILIGMLLLKPEGLFGKPFVSLRR